MKPTNANQEIMLLAGTRFFTREFNPTGRYKKPNINSQADELEQACWAGLLLEMLPELSTFFSTSRAFIWDIHSTEHFVLINQGTEPRQVETAFSIDPHCFVNDSRQS
jgi:hypothetical protein